MSEVYAIKEGGELDLNCPVRSVQNEDMIISWTCDNEPANIRSSRVHVTESGKLRIRSAKVGDSCNYRCEAADGFGTLSSIIKVIIVDKRMINQLSRHNQSLQWRSIQQEMLAQKSLLAPSRMDGTDTIKSGGGGGGGGVLARPDNGNVASVKVTEQQPPASTDLEVSIEPASVKVDKNRTFNLECRVKYAAHHQRPPQIIWLKQYIGQKPSSPNEALEQNLVTIDNAYYHSLNWPRSITYSRNSACANSALLIRQSSFVHSGKYVCFAGYPPYSMATVNLSSSSSSSSSSAAAATSASVASDGSTPTVNKPLKYRMATAMVVVDDPAGEADHKLSLEWNAASDSAYGHRNLFTNFFSTRNWLENILLIMLLTCGLVYAGKFIYLRYKLNKKKRSISEDNSVESGLASLPVHNNPNEDQAEESNENSLPQLAIKRIHQLKLIDSTNNVDNDLQQAFAIDSQLIGNKSNLRQTDMDDHLYSEIGERDKLNSATTNPNDYYKVPNNVLDRVDI